MSATRRRLAAATTAATMLALPAVAQAHHATGSAACDRNNTGRDVIGANMNFVGFTGADKPIRTIDIWVDGGLAAHATEFTFPGSDGQWPAPGARYWVSAAPGVHKVVGIADWATRGGMPHSFVASVVCPNPPAAPTPTPTPTPAPPTPPAPPVTPPSPPVRPHQEKPRFTRHVVRARIYNGDPLPIGTSARHRTYWISRRFYPRRPAGTTHAPTQLFLRLHGPHASRLRWYVDGRRVHGTRWARLSSRVFSDWLFDTAVFGVPDGRLNSMADWRHVYGWHTVRVVFRAPAAASARTARSSWS